jgi:hypothetical protein
VYNIKTKKTKDWILEIMYEIAVLTLMGISLHMIYSMGEAAQSSGLAAMILENQNMDSFFQNKIQIVIKVVQIIFLIIYLFSAMAALLKLSSNRKKYDKWMFYLRIAGYKKHFITRFYMMYEMGNMIVAVVPAYFLIVNIWKWMIKIHNFSMIFSMAETSNQFSITIYIFVCLLLMAERYLVLLWWEIRNK